MTWSDQLNRTVMRCYYIATKLETVQTGYRFELHALFLKTYPELSNTVTEQRLIDQKRVILKNNRLTGKELEQIKLEVAQELNHTSKESDIQINRKDMEEHDEDIHTSQQPATDKTLELNVEQEIAQPSTLLTQQIVDGKQLEEEMETNLSYWQGTDPNLRNPIPKLIFKPNTSEIISTTNTLIQKYLTPKSTLEDIHAIIYAAAVTIIKHNGQKITQQMGKSKIKHKPKWQIRIESKIENLRKDIGHMTQHLNGNKSKKIKKSITKILKNKTTKSELEILDTMKQKLAVYAGRLRRYKESNERKDTNLGFNQNEKKFYRTLLPQESAPATTEIPSKQELTEFWSNIWSKPLQHNNSSEWIKIETERHDNIQVQTDHHITQEELSETIKHTQNWKCPGADKLQNFWYKQFSSTYEILTREINNCIRDPNIFPKFLTQGNTYVKPKNADTKNPANYRPITCLPTLYKIITATICRKIDAHLTKHNILSEEQKGCRKFSQACKEQLIIDTIILKQTEKDRRNLHTSYIDYKKAFDSVPHSWLLKILEIYKIDPNIRKFLKEIMESWRTKITIKAESEYIQTDELYIRRGIFQGDGLSALWFCMCLNPLSNALNDSKYGFNIKHQKKVQHKINHLLYMDDIKIYASTRTELKELLKITENFTKDIRMEFGISKCKALHIEKGKWNDNENREIINNETLENMAENQTYKYLGFEQNIRINHTDIKTQLKTQYKQRLLAILKTSLYSRNLFKAINTFAVPILTYSFGIIKWSQTDLENLHILTRSELTRYRKHHPNCCKERVTINRKEGGRGMIDIQALHAKQIQLLRNYFLNKQTSLHQAVCKADKNYTPLDLSTNNHSADIFTPIQHIEQKINTWTSKQLHGKHRYIIEQNHISKPLSYKWLQDGKLFPETEGFLLAIQDQVIATLNYQKYIIKDPNIHNDMCRKCHQFKETIDHITSGCKILAGTDYTERHNMAGRIIHQALAKTYKLITEERPYYKYTPNTIIDTNEYKLYWDVEIRTDKTITCNRPDIVFQNKKEQITYLIDIAIPNDTNIQNKYNEKIAKYAELGMEVQRLWKQKKVTVIPIVISTTGITPDIFDTHLKQLGLNPHIHTNIQKSVILKTCNIVRSFLNSSGRL